MEVALIILVAVFLLGVRGHLNSCGNMFTEVDTTGRTPVGTPLTSLPAANILRCFKLCLYHEECTGSMYNSNCRVCHLYGTSLYDLQLGGSGGTVEGNYMIKFDLDDEDVCHAGIRKDDVNKMFTERRTTNGGSTCGPEGGAKGGGEFDGGDGSGDGADGEIDRRMELVFGVRKETGIHVLKAWYDDSIICTGPSCSNVYRSSVVNNWQRKFSDSKISKVAIVLFSGGDIVAWILFNANGANRGSWFTPNRLISSSWSDLPKSPGFRYKWYLDGTRYQSTLSRDFTIAEKWCGCACDPTWIIVSEFKSTRHCSFDRLLTHPQFLYSKISTADRFIPHSRMGRAEWFTIYVQ